MKRLKHSKVAYQGRTVLVKDIPGVQTQDSILSKILPTLHPRYYSFSVTYAQLFSRMDALVEISHEFSFPMRVQFLTYFH